MTPARLWLAPMAGVTDRSFRALCREQGCPAAVTEMVSAKALRFGSQPTLDLVRPGEGEGFLAAQVFGRVPEDVAWAAAFLADRGFPWIDLNMGCPAPKITGNGEGSALLKDPPLAQRVAAAAVRAAGTPVSVKLRLGWDEAHINVVEMARRLQDAGVALLAVHGRTTAQQYGGRAAREWIARAREAVSIPVLANGDVAEPRDALSLLADTGCHGVMVGRGAMGNPWLFRRIQALFAGETDPGLPAPAERLGLALRHLRLLVGDKGERVGVKEMRKHAAWYTRGLPGAAQVRVRINAAATLADMEAVLLQYIMDMETMEGTRTT